MTEPEVFVAAPRAQSHPRRKMFVLSFVAALAIAGIVAVSVTQTRGNTTVSDSSPQAHIRTMLARTELTHPLVTIVPGSKEDTIRFELTDVDGTPLIQSRDVEGESELHKVIDQIATVARIDSVRQSAFSVFTQMSPVGGQGTVFSFAVRALSGQVIGFSSRVFTHAQDVRDAIDRVIQVLPSVVISVAHPSNPAPDFVQFYGLSVPSSGHIPSVVFELTTDEAQEKFGFRVYDNSEVIYELAPTALSKAVCLHLLSEYMRRDETPNMGHILDSAIPPPPPVASLTQKEAWDAPDMPARFELQGAKFEYNYQAIKEKGWNQGGVEVPAWPDTYWPTFEDGLAARWQSLAGVPEDRACSDNIDCLSPLEKYDAAFNKWVPGKGFFDLKKYSPDMCGWQTAAVKPHWDKSLYAQLGPATKGNKGNQICHNGRDDSHNGLVDDCNKNGCEYYSETGGAMLARWFGLCHQWVPASILLPEAQHSVRVPAPHLSVVPDAPEYVEFQVSDLKGLGLTLSFASVFFGTRCNLNDEDVPRDRFGRIDDQVCRNTNAGAFHVVLANLLGNEKRMFAMDRTWDAAVWNQPVVSFNTTREQAISTAKEACEWLGGCNGQGYSWNPKARSWVAVDVEVGWVMEAYPSRKPRAAMVGYFTKTSEYQYLLELDQAGNIIGGEWKFGNPEHPDFLFLPYDREPFLEDGFVGMEYEKVADLLAKSVAPNTNNKAQGDSNTVSFVGGQVVTSDVHTLQVEEESFVFETRLTLTLTPALLNLARDTSVSAEVSLAHGLSHITFPKFTVRPDAQTVTFTTLAFSNMRASGEWQLKIALVGGEPEAVVASSWEVTMSTKVRQPRVFTWPECVGMTAADARDHILSHTGPQPITSIPIVHEHDMVTADYRTERVRLWVNDEGVITLVPTRG